MRLKQQDSECCCQGQSPGQDYIRIRIGVVISEAQSEIGHCPAYPGAELQREVCVGVVGGGLYVCGTARGIKLQEISLTAEQVITHIEAQRSGNAVRLLRLSGIEPTQSSDPK